MSKNLDDFQKFLINLSSEKLTEEALTGKLMSDGELSDEEFSFKACLLIARTTPWGQYFPEPLFDGTI